MTEPTTEIAVIIEEAIQSALSSGQKASYSSQISNTVNSTITQVILIILSIATLVTVLDYLGWLPPKARRFLHLNRAQDTVETLKEFGINVRNYKDATMALRFPKGEDPKSIIQLTIKAMKQHLFNEKCAVGHTNRTEIPRYYDIIGAVCSPQKAADLASLMAKYWTYYFKNNADKIDLGFDFVVTPKGGSPTLGYEFAKLLDVPFALHEESDRIHNHADDARTRFDMETILPKRQRALVVDDSITGGTMVNKTIKDLRKYGYEATACFVIFEVCAKNGRAALEGNNVNLISMVKVKSRSTEASDNQLGVVFRSPSAADNVELQEDPTSAGSTM